MTEAMSLPLRRVSISFFAIRYRVLIDIYIISTSIYVVQLLILSRLQLLMIRVKFSGNYHELLIQKRPRDFSCEIQYNDSHHWKEKSNTTQNCH